MLMLLAVRSCRQNTPYGGPLHHDLAFITFVRLCSGCCKIKIIQETGGKSWSSPKEARHKPLGLLSSGFRRRPANVRWGSADLSRNYNCASYASRDNFQTLADDRRDGSACMYFSSIIRFAAQHTFGHLL